MPTFKKVITTIFESPAIVLTLMSGWVLGRTEKNEDGADKIDPKTRKPIVHNGLLGLILDGGKAGGRAISAFLSDHKKAISYAFWGSVLVGGGLALALYAFPAVLTAVASYSILGWSIAALSTNPLVQIGIASGLAAAATSVLTCAAAVVINTITAIKDCCCPEPESEPKNSQPEGAGSASHLSQLSKNDASIPASQQADEPPTHTGSIHQPAPNVDGEENHTGSTLAI